MYDTPHRGVIGMSTPHSDKKVNWGDDCPVCGTEKSIIAGVDMADHRRLIFRCLKCHTIFPHI